jgi:phospholipid/cholesterol/gamma-HCH transport system substrate-binding protein
METKSHVLATGLFVLLLGAALIGVIAWFQGDHRSTHSYTVVARNGVPGLNLKAPVKLNGVEIGKVEEIGFDPDNPRQVLVGIEVVHEAPITTATVARLGYQGITGLSFIDLSDDAGVLQPKPRPAHSRIELHASALDEIVVSGPRVLASINQAAERVNQLLAEGNQQQLMHTLKSFDAAAAQLGQLAQNLQPAAVALTPAVQHADAVLRQADGTLHRIDGLADESTLLARDLRQRATALDHMAAAADQLQRTAARLEAAMVGPDKPAQQPLIDALNQAAKAVENAAKSLDEEPQSVLVGRPAHKPGPGEAGFDPHRQ